MSSNNIETRAELFPVSAYVIQVLLHIIGMDVRLISFLHNHMVWGSILLLGSLGKCLLL